MREIKRGIHPKESRREELCLQYGKHNSNIVDLNFQESSIPIYKYRVRPNYKRNGGRFKFELDAQTK